MSSSRGFPGATNVDFDVIIIGAGMGGINLAYHIQTQGPPGITYAILESHDFIGGTWDVFKYPGVRTDSDANTFGFYWNPWKSDLSANSLVAISGSHVLSYIKDSAAINGIDKHMLFQHNVVSANWQSDSRSWSLEVLVDEKKQKTFRTSFVLLGTGYFDHKDALPNIMGLGNFSRQVVNAQSWPEGFDYSDQDIVVIGSGATATTLVPALAVDAKRVTMLQRSPSYLINLKTKDTIGDLIRLVFPWNIAARINRIRWVFIGDAVFHLSRHFPRLFRSYITNLAIQQLPGSISWDPHFNPSYGPWEKRPNFCPDGDFYKALHTGKLQIVTDIIQDITEHEIQLESGQVLRPDIIILATGFKLQFGGNIKLYVDGEAVDPGQKFSWRGALLQDVPNLAFGMGYWSGSHTPGVDVAAVLISRLLREMKSKNASTVVPRLSDSVSMKEQPVSPLSSSYFQVGAGKLPKAGQGMWAPKHNYWIDMYKARWGDITTDLVFSNDEVDEVETNREVKKILVTQVSIPKMKSS